MLFLGHIAATLLLADATGADREAAVAGNLVPDVVDKSARQLGLVPSGRWWAHGLPALLLCSAIVGLSTSPRRGLSFALGYLGHLLCDLYLGGRVPWAIPLRSYAPPPRKRASAVYWLLYLLPELAGAMVIAKRGSNAAPMWEHQGEAAVS